MWNDFLGNHLRKGAAVLGAALFVCQFIPVSALALKSQETYQDLISKAENLSLQRDRLKATQVLIQGIEKEKRNSTAWKRLNAALDNHAGLFYTDKTQKVFELAESLFFSGSSQALAKYQEALALEPDNLTMLLATARASLSANQCQESIELLNQAATIHPYSAQVILLKMTALTCRGGIAEAQALKLQPVAQEEIIRPYIYTLEAHWKLAAGDHQGSLESASQAIGVDAHFPEGYYWKWKASAAKPEVAIGAAEKYLALCKDAGPKQKRKYLNEPQLCARQTETENFLKEARQREEG